MPTYEKHPFIKDLLKAGAATTGMPEQKILWKQKRKTRDKYGVSDWEKANLDFAESEARRQYKDNIKLIENERLVNGELVSSVSPTDLCQDCEEDFFQTIHEINGGKDIPKDIRNYDMIGIPIKKQVTEFNNRPDTISLKGFGEPMENDRFKVQKDLIQKWAFEQLDLYFNNFLNTIDVDPNQEFEDPQQQQEFSEYIENLREERTPEEIGRYMKNDFVHYFEQWANYELEDQIERFKLKQMRRREFLQYITVGKRFRFLNVTKDGFHVEPLDHTEVYYRKDKRVPLIQHGDFAGTITIESASSVVASYGHLMTEDQAKSFDLGGTYWRDRPARPKTDYFGNKVDYLDTDGLPFNQYLPTADPHINRIAPNLGINWVEPSGGLLPGQPKRNDQYYVIKHFWRSFARIGRLAWTNPATGMYEVSEVDETFVVPDFIKVLRKGTFSDPVEPDTIIWTWKEEIWQGIKISNLTYGPATEAVYLDIRPCEYQGNSYVFKNKPLPIVGQVTYSPNLTTTNQVDIFKPYAYMFNLAMNKAFKLMQLTYGSFLAMDVRMIPNHKDWGGEGGTFNWLETAQETQIGPVDTSPSNMQGSNSNIFPKEINIDNSQKAMAALNIATNIRMMALSQAGFTPERLGQVKGVTATGVEEGLEMSFTATDSWFIDYWEAEANILQQQLEVAQWLQAKGKDFSALLSKGIISESILTNNPDSFDLYSLRVYVTNNQEALRQLELFRQLALDNTTEADMSTRMEMVGSNNAAVILNMVKHEEEKARARAERMQQIEQELSQEQNELERQRLEQEREKFYAQLENNLQKAAIMARGFVDPGEADMDGSGVPDVFEYEKFLQTERGMNNNFANNQQRLAFEKDREATRKLEKQQELSLKQQEINQKREQVEATRQNVKILDKGTYKGNRKK